MLLFTRHAGWCPLGLADFKCARVTSAYHVYQMFIIIPHTTATTHFSNNGATGLSLAAVLRIMTRNWAQLEEAVESIYL